MIKISIKKLVRELPDEQATIYGFGSNQHCTMRCARQKILWWLQWSSRLLHNERFHRRDSKWTYCRHYMPHHPVYKKSTTTPIRIVFNASRKPTGGKSLNDCLLTGPTLTTKLHDILLTFQEDKHAVTADISKAFHRVIVDERDRDYLRFLWINHDQSQLRTFRFKVVLFTVSIARNHSNTPCFG